MADSLSVRDGLRYLPVADARASAD